MFTVETEFDHTKVVVMDDGGQRNDLIIRFTADGIYFSQWYNDEQRYQTVWLTDKMLSEAIFSLNSKDGTYKTNT
tara:strand:+ start:183 stop:407 length:225 start_codon:yes stop_codon:yes gene_type:complete